MSAASSPIPDPAAAFAACGHDGCGTTGCNVRYVGPVSHVRDHHALHAARGVAHVWTAAIVSGLAVVVTGFLAYNAAQAREIPVPRGSSSDMRAIMQRLDRMEMMMREAAERCVPPPADPQGDDGSGTSPDPHNQGQLDMHGDGQDNFPSGDRHMPPNGGRRALPPPPRGQGNVPASEAPAAEAPVQP